MEQRSGRRWCTLLTVTLVLVIAADLLFHRQAPGCSVACFAALLGLALLLFGVGVTRQRAVACLAVLMGGLVLALLLEPTPLAVAMTLVGAIMLGLTQRHGWTGDVGVWLRRGRSLLGRGTLQWAHDLHLVARVRASSDARAQRQTGLRRWLPAVGFGLVFLALFALANPVLAGWLEDVAQRAFDLGTLLDPLRLFLWIGAALLAWAVLRTRAARHVPRRAFARVGPLSEATLLRSLWVFNALFLLQNALDVRHLLLGAALPEGLTYATYARQGAYPLLAAALLSASFVLVTFRSDEERFGRGARGLVHAFLAQNVALTAFAIVRLTWYVEAYSLSRMRVAAFLWMVLVGVGLMLILVRVGLRRTNRWLLGANASAAALLLYACCFPNWDRLIADYNVAHCREIRRQGVPIDLDYLAALGPDALPACRRLQREALDDEVRVAAGALADRQRARLDEQLLGWRGWTLRRQALRDADPAGAAQR
jgi:hypothetical protein